MPRATTVIAVHNGRQYIDDAVNSVLNQDITDHELIVVDDGSTDGTAEFVESLLSRQDRVAWRLIRFEQNRGRCAARNQGLEAARGEWVQILDCDDQYAPEKLRLQLECTELSDERVAAVYSPYRQYHINNTGQKIWEESIFPDIEYVNPANFVLKSGAVHHSCMLLRRSAILAVGGYQTAYEPWEDEEIKLRLVRAGYCFRRTTETHPLFFFRLFPEQSRWGGQEARYNILRVADALVAYLRDVESDPRALYPALTDAQAGEVQWLLRTVGRLLLRVDPVRYHRFEGAANALFPKSIRWHQGLRWRLAALAHR